MAVGSPGSLPVCLLLVTFGLVSVSSKPEFIWNPGTDDHKIEYTESCGLSSLDTWTVDKGFLTFDPGTRGQWDTKVIVSAISQVCEISLTDCSSGVELSFTAVDRPCYCYNQIGDTFVLKMKVKGSRVNSEATLKATLRPASGSSQQPVESVIGTLPVIYDPLTADLSVNQGRPLQITKGQTLDVTTHKDVTSLTFCARGLLVGGATVLVQVGGAETERSGVTCVTSTTTFTDHNKHQLKLGYRESQGCQRFYSFTGQISWQMDSSVTKADGDDQFEDLEMTYGILLGSIAAIFIVVCIVAWLWYYRTKINLKITREHELQGSLDFDKFDTRIEDSTI